jgi:heptaprenyl diphosphate synthase
MEWLRSLLYKYTSDRQLSERYALAASLLQHGLDTHDEVPINNHLPDLSSFRAMQLKVLAGDYFSSRYYDLLAQNGDITMVRKLAEAVCKVNHLKIHLYEATQSIRLNLEQYMDLMIQIKLPVIQSFKSLLPIPIQEKWDSIVSVLTACELLWTELQAPIRPFRFLHWFVLENGNAEEKVKLRSGQYELTWLEGLATKYRITDYILVLFEKEARVFEYHLRQMKDDALELLWQQFCTPLLARTATTPNAVH